MYIHSNIRQQPHTGSGGWVELMFTKQKNKGGSGVGAGGRVGLGVGLDMALEHSQGKHGTQDSFMQVRHNGEM